MKCYLIGQEKELMKTWMQQLCDPLIWVAMHVLFVLIWSPKASNAHYL